MKQLYYLVLALVALMCCQCTGKVSKLNEPVAYNEYVTAYTAGCVPRKSDVRVLLSQDIPQGRMDSVKAAEVMQLSPKVEGSYSYADARTLLFTPATTMSPNTEYSVQVALDKVLDDAQEFQFAFKTRPLAIGGNLKSLEVTEDEQYELTYSLYTADSESPKEVESHVSLVYLPKSEVTWSHATDGLSHELKVRTKPESDCSLELYQVEDKKVGAERKVITSTVLPSTKQLEAVSFLSKPGDRQCIEVTFNKNLDPKQDLTGLVTIEGADTQIDIEGNKLLLYANMDESENETVTVAVAKSVRSRSGLTLAKGLSRQVTISTQKPEVQFVGDGTIIPQSDRILVPFRAIYMRGVRVMVFKVFANMMGTMLLRGDISEDDYLNYAARPVAATTFYMDEQGADLTKWNTYAIDLTEQMKLEPGAMYRVELSLDARLSAWPCDSLPKATREELAAEDARVLAASNEGFDESRSYYYTGRYRHQSFWWDDNYYEHYDDPAYRYYYSEHTVGKNVLATNIGLTALRGSAQALSVTAIGLPDALPMSGVEMTAYSMQQQVVGTGKSNDEGIAEIRYDAKLGQPAYVVARKGDDVSYLKVTTDQTLSTSTFDVSGNVIERGLKGFIYGDRGVWRPGDTLHIAFMLNDRDKTLPEEHPVTLRLTNPLGQEACRMTRTQGAMGLYVFEIPTAEDALTGIWSAQIQVGGVTFAKNLRIETIKPNRLKIDLKLPEETLAAGNSQASLHTEWLNGIPARGLKYDITATLIETTTGWKGWKDYVFDNPTKTFETSEQLVARGEVGATGDATCTLKLNPGNTAPGMLRGNLVTHVYEPSGEFSVDVTQLIIAPYSHFVGIKAPAQANQSHLDTDRDHTFQVASVNKEGKAIPAVKVRVDIYKVDWYWWWNSSREDMAGYTSSKYNKPVKTLSVVTDSQGQGSFTLNMTQANWGTYLIVAQDLTSGHSAGTLSYFDWPWMTSRRSDVASENATALTLTTDKQEYAPGEKIRLNIPSEAGSRAIVSVSNGSRILQLNTYPCQAGHTEIVLDATEAMTPNVYLGVSLVQPYHQTLNDMPIRMYGLTPITVTSPRSHLAPVVTCADEFRPESRSQVTVSEKEGRPMAYTLAIVDEGLLDLTRFKTPNAWDVFNAREALGTRFWDLYSHVNGAYGGRIEQLFSIGGDEALNNTPKAIVNRFRPMVHFAGPFTLKKGEKRTHKVNVPNYNGRVRVMVVAGDGSAYGSADKSVLVNRPLMLIGTMPRQIGRGDEMTVSATVFATDRLGDVQVSLKGSKGLQVVGEASQTIRMDEAGDKTIQFSIKDDGQGGSEGMVTLVATSGSYKADYTSPISIRTVSQTLSNTIEKRVEAGATLEETLTMPGEGDYRLLLGASAVQPLNVGRRLSQLISYPHGCVEQTTSKAFPQLYLDDFSALSPEQQREVEANVKNCIERLPSYQTKEGGMSYWPGARSSHQWASGYVLHFLSEAMACGYYVPDNLMRNLKMYVKVQAAAWSDKDDLSTTAYMLYVLSAMQMPELGAMNRMRERAATLPADARHLLSAAYALAGREDAELHNNIKGEEKNYSRWMPLEVACLLDQLAIGDNHASESAETIRKRLMSEHWLSTSDCAFSLIALSQYYKKHQVGKGLQHVVTVDGKQVAEVKSHKFAWSQELPVAGASCRLAWRNTSDAEMYVTLTTQGTATQGKVERMNQGLEVTARYTTDDDKPLTVSELAQSTTFRCAVTISNTAGTDLENIAVTHILPAGWEILSASGAGTIHYQDRRDDRLLSYIDLLRKGESVTIRLNLSATYAGRFYLPSVQAEAMYDAKVMGCTESDEVVVAAK